MKYITLTTAVIGTYNTTVINLDFFMYLCVVLITKYRINIDQVQKHIIPECNGVNTLICI